MTRRHGAGREGDRGIRGLALAGLLIVCGVLAGLPAQAFEPTPGGKNFTAPSSVPNYFSNEAAPFGRVSSLAQPGADRFNTAPIAAAVSPAVMSMPPRNIAASARRSVRRGMMARVGHGRLKFVSSRASRAHASGAHAGRAQGRRALARASAHSASRHFATRNRAAASRSRYAARDTRHAGRSFR
jgi:hypothetical protein